MDENATPKKETQNGVSSCTSDSGNNSEDVSMEASSKDLPTETSSKDPATETSSKDPATETSLEDQPKEEWMDILGNGQLKKKVIKKGRKSVRAYRGSVCTVRIIGTVDNTVVEDHYDISIQVGDLEVIQGLDLTIVLMELGEVAEVVIDPRFAYGTLGTESIPPNATITYTIELKHIQPEPEDDYLSVNERREIGNKKRERGNWWFSRKDFSSAIQCYRRALHYLQMTNSKKWEDEDKEETETVTDSELQTLLDDCVKVYNNLAAALIETGAYNTALENVDLVLKHQPQNTKALLRKGRILKLKGEYGKAYVTFLEAQKLEPEMKKSVQAEVTSLKEKISKESAKEKHLYAKMLGISKEANKPSKNVKENTKVEEKSKIAKGILWTLLGASAAIVGILIHRFGS